MSSASSTSTRGIRTRRINRAVCLAALATAGAFASNRALASDFSWSRAAGNPGNFGDGTNWLGGVAPGTIDNGFINNGGIATVATGFTGTVTDVRIGNNPAGSGGYSQTGGTLNSANFAVGGDATGTGTFNIIGGALNIGSGNVGDFSIGDDGVGTATIGGGVITTRFAFLGKSTHGSGHVTQTGGGLVVQRNFVMDELKPADTSAVQNASDYTMSGGSITVGSEMYIGAHGPCTFNLSSTGSISIVGTLHIAASGGFSDPPGGTGTLNMNGGTINISGAGGYFVVADHGDGTFNFSAGNVHTSYFNIGQNFEPGFSTKGVVNQTGGSATAEYAWVVGEQSRSASLYDLSAGTVTVVGAGIPELPGDLNIASEAGARGTVMVRGTGVANIGNGALLGNASNTSGTLSVGGSGVLSLGLNGSGTGFLVVGINGAGNFQSSGGTTTADGATLGQNATGLGTGTQTGGSVVLRNNLSIGEASNLANVYDISAGTLAVGTAGIGGIFIGSTGTGTLKVSGTAVVTAAASIENANSGVGTVLVSGGSLTSPAFANKGLYSQSGGVASLGVITGTGTANVSGGTLSATSIQHGTLNVNTTGLVKIAVNGTNSGLSVVDNLFVTGSGKLDLNDNDLLVHNGSYTTIAGSIKNARNNGLWNGPGITSSTAAAASPKNKTLGTLTGTQFHTAQGAGATFDAATVNNPDIVVKYTYYGDADLNGKVNFDDYAKIDAGFNNHATDWFGGDFDYNGKVNFDDYALIDAAFNSQSGTLGRAMHWLSGDDRSGNGMSSPSLQLVEQHYAEFGDGYARSFIASVPEPASIGMVLLGTAASLLARRRRDRF